MEWVAASTSIVNPDETEFIVQSGAAVHMMSKTDLSPEGWETVKVSRLPTTVITAKGSIDTTEEATVYVQDWDVFVTVQPVEDTPEVLSLGKTLTGNLVCIRVERRPRDGKIVPCKCDTFVHIVVPGLSSEAHLTRSAENPLNASRS